MNMLKLIKFIVCHPLNRKAPMTAIGKFIRWQIASRAIPTGIALPFIDNLSLLTSKGMTGATGNWYCGLHESGEMGFVLHMLRNGDLFVDVGANIGSYSLVGFAAGANVISVEPIPKTYEKLLANIALNHAGGRIKAFRCGLSRAAGMVSFTSDQDTMNRVLLSDETGPSIEVSMRTLDEICAMKIPKLIKVDVEGYETEVLAGGQATLADETLEAVILETNSLGIRYVTAHPFAARFKRPA